MTELINKITNISNKLTELYGEEYSKQFNFAINDIKNKTDINITQIIVDNIDLTINDSYKQKQIKRR